MEKNNSLLGFIFIAISLLFGSLFTASLVMVWRTSELTVWIIPLIAGLIYLWIVTTQVVMPIWREYRKPRTQRQFNNLKPLFQFIVMLGMAHVCLSIALGGIWVYFFKDAITGIQMGALGLVLLVLPLAYAVFVALRTIK